MSDERVRPDSLFVFERLAALERSLSSRSGRSHAPASGPSPHPIELQDAKRELARLRSALEIVASLPPEMPDAGRRAVQVAQAALDGEPFPAAR